jgi:hypothetical protein
VKNKTALIAGLVIVFLVILGGAFFVFKKSSNKPVASPSDDGGIAQQNLPPVDSSVVVNLSARADNKAVKLSIAKIPSGTDTIEYELSYTTGAGLPKGAIGKIDVTGKTDIDRDVLLGTCSKNVCTYDAGVTKVSLVLKFNSAKGASQFSKDFPLNGATQGGSGTEPNAPTVNTGGNE